MAIWKSTLGAPLSDEDEANIIEAWSALLTVAEGLRPSAKCDPLEMLERATDLVGAVWRVRRAISDAWYNANKIFDAPRVHPKPKSINILNQLVDLGVSDEELAAALATVRKGEVR